MIQKSGEVLAEFTCVYGHISYGLDLFAAGLMYVCNIAMATGRVAILTNTLQFQSLSNDRYDIINCEWNDKVLSVSLMHI